MRTATRTTPLLVSAPTTSSGPNTVPITKKEAGPRSARGYYRRHCRRRARRRGRGVQWRLCFRRRARVMRARMVTEPFGSGMRESRDRGTRNGLVDQTVVVPAFNYPSKRSAVSVPYTTSATGSTSASGSTGAGDASTQAGPLPRAQVPLANAQRASAGAVREENHEPRSEVGLTSSERHMDAGPVSEASLGRSASGRLPPAYGEQL
ncbi:hypothetical protein C8R46DRAFT_1192617 [Mycena filopes]|nr:hypothetical protein C8R46DRAFT_1192617 [Mycena filopes]